MIRPVSTQRVVPRVAFTCLSSGVTRELVDTFADCSCLVAKGRVIAGGRVHWAQSFPDRPFVVRRVPSPLA
jgi:hypothetical protein